MTKDERAMLLRASLRRVRGYDLPPPPGPKRKRVERTPGVLVYLNFGVPTGNREVPVKFLKTPDPVPEKPLRIKRTTKRSPLATMAAKMPGKLVRKFRTAEGLLAERARQ